MYALKFAARNVAGKLPATVGWQPALPNPKNGRHTVLNWALDVQRLPRRYPCLGGSGVGRLLLKIS